MTDPDLRVSARVGMAVGAEYDPASAGAAHVLRAGSGPGSTPSSTASGSPSIAAGHPYGGDHALPHRWDPATGTSIIGVMYGERLARWERAAEWPLMIAACVFLAAFATEILVRPEGALAAIAGAVLWVTWAMFLIDYVARFVIAEHRRRWFRRHLLDLLIVVLPMLRPLRLMRFLTIVTFIGRSAGSMLRGKVMTYTVAATALTVFVAGLAIFDAERGSGGPIDSFGEAVWWAFVTITTVGYGDYYPVTIVGRLVAVGLMIGGITLIGVVTATLASWIVERVSAETEEKTAATKAQVESLHAEVAELKDLIRQSSPRP